MIRQQLSQKLLQKLSPQQIQFMKLLQVPTIALEQRIKEEMEGNPALEEGAEEPEEITEFDKDTEEPGDETDEAQIDDEVDISDYLPDDDDIAAYKLRGASSGNSDEDRAAPVAIVKSFHENLTQQLAMLELNDKQYSIANQLIGSIDDDGYIRRPLEAMVDDLAFTQNLIVSKEELEKILWLIRKFDPPGVGAHNLQECLLIQLGRKADNKLIKIARKILEKHFDGFVKKHYEKLQKQLGITNDELKGAIDEILKLNPKPGSNSSEAAKAVAYVVPDFMIKNVGNQLELSLNSNNAPELRISESYKEMLRSYDKSSKKDKKQKEAVMFIKQKIDSAQWFIESIKQRQDTLLRTMHTIMKHQYEYLLTGDETKIKPLILKDIAKVTDLDISTVSRVANSKYVQTEFGTFQLKSFFSESLQTESGEEVSTREVKKILTDLIEKEDKNNPLSDQKLMDLLKEKKI